MKKMNNEKIIWDYLYAKLQNPFGAAALMGNLYAESSLNPILANNIQKRQGMTNQEYTDLVDQTALTTYCSFATDGVAYGLAQWYYHTRKQALLDLAIKKGLSVGDINVQLEYLWNELQQYRTVLNTLKSAKSVREASDIVLVRFEKPANQSEGVKVMRARYGTEYLNKYHSNKTVKVKINKELAKEILNALNVGGKLV